MKNKKFDREPDLETESMRVWIPTKEEENISVDDSIEIPIGKGDTKVKICGFTKVMKKDDKKSLLFAYKIKPQQQQILYYIPKDLSNEDRQNIEEVVTKMRNAMPFFDFGNIEEIAEQFEKNEGNTLDKLRELKEKGKDNKPK